MAKRVSSTQENVPIAGVKDGVVILKDGQYRMIFEISAVNFSLKSEEEQNSLVLQYQSFLNSIHFPIEITIRSKRLDLAPYISKIKKLNEKQNNELLKIQTTDYIDFVGQLINLANIMKKTFYVSIGYQPLNVGQGTVLDKLFKRKKDVSASLKISDEEFGHNAKELRSRGQNVAQGLGGIGLHCKQLNTEEVIELFYGIYNPEIAGKERLTEAGNVSSEYVTSSKPKDTTNNVPAAKENAAAGETSTIDNSDLVQEQEKKRAQEKAFENQSTAQRSVGMTAASEATPTANAASSKIQDTSNRQIPNTNDQTVRANPAVQPNQTAQPNPASATGGLASSQNQTSSPTPATAAPTPNQAQTIQQQVADPSLNKDYGW